MDSPELSVAKFLKPLAEQRETGALEVYRGPYRGLLYLQKGVLIQAEYLGKVGLSAAYDILDLTSSTMEWRPLVAPVNTSINLDLVSLLEELETRKNHPPDPVLPDPVKAPVEETPREAKSTIPVFSGNQETSSALLQQLYIQIEWLNSFEPVSPFEFETRDQAGYTVGSSEDCDFYLPHPGVQPLHFSLLVHADHVEIWDLGTDNATSLNNEIITQAVLSSGDIIQAGDAKLRFSLHVRRAGKISEAAPEAKEPVVPAPVSERIRGPITAESIARQQSQNPALRKMIGNLFTKKGK